MLRIGPYPFSNPLVAAPMAGVTDRPFRQLCRAQGAALVVSEMVATNPRLRGTLKSQRRLDHSGEPGPRVVQIAGGEPAMMAEAARYNVDRGADIIDINMGCPAKKVCRKAAGSALLANEDLVRRILDETVAAVSVPVTLKIRTGPDHANRNGVRIARKHLNWQFERRPPCAALRFDLMAVDSSARQFRLLQAYYQGLEFAQAA